MSDYGYLAPLFKFLNDIKDLQDPSLQDQPKMV